MPKRRRAGSLCTRVSVKDAGKKGSGLFAKAKIKKGEIATKLILPNLVDRKECGDTFCEREEWWWDFSGMNGLRVDNVVFWGDGLVYDFHPPGRANFWYFMNHSSKMMNVEPEWTGKNMFFRATCDIERGSELLWSYNNSQEFPTDWEV